MALYFRYRCLIGLITLVFLKAWLPALPVEQEGDTRSHFQIFRNPETWLIILITAIGTGGLFAWISYIAPLMTISPASRLIAYPVSWYWQDSVWW
ncbi:hypothetical protein [Chitinophaga pinensis]|uniref:hypothetical protein n=1 Tax=Chitinophaga pinensis TaxID=79329 RepID=UPI0021BDD659|nr:hypothetical protein [Chitinophaga pinensis]